MKKALESLGLVNNVFVMPNFKNMEIIKEKEMCFQEKPPFKVCTFSRVMKEKGIEDAVNAVSEINKFYGRAIYELDIYGQIDLKQKKWFDNLCSTFPPFVKYRGIVPFDKSTQVIKNYYLLLFPTHYSGEGFPGTLIDSWSSGVPVIASNWKYNPELISNGKTGYIYNIFDEKGLCERLCFAANNSTDVNKMKSLCIKRANEFLPENVLSKFINDLLFYTNI